MTLSMWYRALDLEQPHAQFRTQLKPFERLWVAFLQNKRWTSKESSELRGLVADVLPIARGL